MRQQAENRFRPIFTEKIIACPIIRTSLSRLHSGLFYAMRVSGSFANAVATIAPSITGGYTSPVIRTGITMFMPMTGTMPPKAWIRIYPALKVSGPFNSSARLHHLRLTISMTGDITVHSGGKGCATTGLAGVGLSAHRQRTVCPEGARDPGRLRQAVPQRLQGAQGRSPR